MSGDDLLEVANDDEKQLESADSSASLSQSVAAPINGVVAAAAFAAVNELATLSAALPPAYVTFVRDYYPQNQAKCVQILHQVSRRRFSLARH